MKTLTLLRHAKSSWNDPIERDFDRPLNARGRRAARTVGREMRAQGLSFDRVLASPAVRVVETLEDVADGYGGSLAPEFDRRIYLATPEILLELVQQADDQAATLLVIGHNPGLERLALLLSKAGDLRKEIEVKYPTATLTQIEFAVDRWSDVVEGAGTIARFIRPRDLDPELGPDEDSF
nr:histidine phosphatase family protein [uncultured Sphingosinicella sp.]